MVLPIFAQLVVANAGHAQASGSWYYCDPLHGYYPYVSRCPIPWRAVTPYAYGQMQPSPAEPAVSTHAAPAPTLVPPPQAQQPLAYQQGQADRQAWEIWFGTLPATIALVPNDGRASAACRGPDRASPRRHRPRLAGQPAASPRRRSSHHRMYAGGQSQSTVSAGITPRHLHRRRRQQKTPDHLARKLRLARQAQHKSGCQAPKTLRATAAILSSHSPQLRPWQRLSHRNPHVKARLLSHHSLLTRAGLYPSP